MCASGVGDGVGGMVRGQERSYFNWSHGKLVTQSKKLSQKPEWSNKTSKTESNLKSKGSRWGCWFSWLSSNRGGKKEGSIVQVVEKGQAVVGRRERMTCARHRR